MTTFRPHLATDVDLTKLKYPVIALVKYDGTRLLNIGGQAVGRSLKPFRNPEIQRLFGGPEFAGLDGELLCSDLDPLDPAQCRSTSSRTSAFNGGPGLVWRLFDDLTNPDEPYTARLQSARKRFAIGPIHLEFAQHRIIESEAELLAYEREVLDAGAEGLILRDPQGKHKNGRATVKEGSFLKLKRMSDAEGVVVGLQEAMENRNEATTNALGHTERSTHKANMVGKAMVGALLLEGGVIVGPGALTHDERSHYWANPHEIVGKTITYQHFAYGAKDKPRAPVFKSVRQAEDMS
jgi:DNA ligase 1